MLCIVGLVLLAGFIFLVIGYCERKRSNKVGRWFVNIFIVNTPAEVIKLGWLITVIGVILLVAGYVPQVWKMIFG
jgi:FtsH-binding integral membrane protein